MEIIQFFTNSSKEIWVCISNKYWLPSTSCRFWMFLLSTMNQPNVHYIINLQYFTVKHT